MTRSIKLRPDGSRRVTTNTGTKSRVEPQHKNECDINTIMRKMHAQGVLPQFRTGAMYGDFTGLKDFQSSTNRIVQANNDFMALPAELRKKFDNDPGKFLDFLHDPENIDECRSMGLIAPEGTEPPPEVKTSQKGSDEPTNNDPPEKGDKKPASVVSA